MKLTHRLITAAAVVALAAAWVGASGAATFTVTSDVDADHGTCGATCSIRDAITAANTSAGPDTITFAAPIYQYLLEPLPPLTGPTLVDGTTAPAYVGVPRVTLDSISGQFPGLTLQAAGITVKAIEIRNFGQSLLILAPGGDTVQRSTFVVEYPGTHDAIRLVNSASNQIGGTGAGEGNTITGGYDRGIVSLGTSAGNHFEGNVLAHNDLGMWIEGLSNVIGGTADGAGNSVGGNTGHGILITGKKTKGTVVQGNKVGDFDGVGEDLRNDGSGIVVGAGGTLVGGTTPGARNYVSGNARVDQVENAGILLTSTGNVVENNYVGTDLSGAGNPLNGSPVQGNLQAGILDLGGSNKIGGPTAAQGNLVSGNVFGIVVRASGDLIAHNEVGVNAAGGELSNSSHGIEVHGSSATIADNLTSNSRDGWGMSVDGLKNVITGNRIGTDAAGTTEMGNQAGGVMLNGRFVFGGTTLAARNIVSGNGPVGFGGQTGPGVQIGGQTSKSILQGNYIGVDATGAVAMPNGGFGIVAYRGATGNTIGGSAAGAGNVISGNGDAGVYILDDETTYANVVAGNRIGTDAAGTAALENGGDGIRIEGAAGTKITGNLLSGNHGAGVGLQLGATGTVITGNRIGTDATGTAAIGNFGAGVGLGDASGNIVGGGKPSTGNLISGNTDSGVQNFASNTVTGNLIGTQADGVGALGNGRYGIETASDFGDPTALGGTKKGTSNVIAWNTMGGVGVVSGNAVLGGLNSFFGNGGPVIDNFVDGPTPNDPGDMDTGPDGMQNFPVLTAATPAKKGYSIAGTLDGLAGTRCVIYFYASPATDVPAQGHAYLGNTALQIPLAGGPAAFTFTLKGAYPAGTQITAIAVGPDGPSEGSAAVTL